MLTKLSWLAGGALSSGAVLLAQQAPDPIAGNTGWIGAGLLGSVLAWLMFVHLPAKDKQLATMLGTQQEEREKERNNRHQMVQDLNAMMLRQVTGSGESLAKIQDQHLKDAERDREAFANRYDHLAERLTAAIQLQTTQLINAINASCRFDARAGTAPPPPRA